MNEVVEKKNDVVVDLTKVEDLSHYNQNNGDNILALNIVVRTLTAKKGNKFKSVKTMMYLPYYDANDGFKCYKNVKVDTHFTKDAFDNVYSECGIHKVDDLQTGTLYVRKKSVQAPFKWLVTENEQGEKEYPSLWVKGDIIGFAPYTPDEDSFKYHAPIKDAEIVNNTIEEESDEEFKGVE